MSLISFKQFFKFSKDYLLFSMLILTLLIARNKQGHLNLDELDDCIEKKS